MHRKRTSRTFRSKNGICDAYWSFRKLDNEREAVSFNALDYLRTKVPFFSIFEQLHQLKSSAVKDAACYVPHPDSRLLVRASGKRIPPWNRELVPYFSRRDGTLGCLSFDHRKYSVNQNNVDKILHHNYETTKNSGKPQLI